jgi:hypothetical protein
MPTIPNTSVDITVKKVQYGHVNVFVEIGNSDNKLDQAQWAAFCEDTEQVIMGYATDVFGMYYSLPHSRFQNACFHLSVAGDEWNNFESDIAEVKDQYNQESVAVSQGDTVFVTGDIDNAKGQL